MNIQKIDIAMPTYESGDVVESSLKAVRDSLTDTHVDVGNLIIVDNNSTDHTPQKIQAIANDFGWELNLIEEETRLPEARQILIEEVETEWFLFLDDDAIVTESYLSDLIDAISPLTGAVQGKKSTDNRSPAEWVHRRSMRGGTHATLIRRKAVAGVEFPTDLVVLEDEYLRRYVENEQSYLWIFNHQAIFEHENQHRHSVGWREGYLAGKYNLRPSYRVLVDIPASVKALTNPTNQIKRTAGYIVGKISH
ncbi:glycosyltransferase [Halorubrum ezzemoulense]|uniref:glycosyltransferase n=1 Tax=Halorubrum ezzemoulense TaxID=337243 RepID=UPI0023304C08|nr:glycosyltransferase [Halorubrum ezzemoulense]MDB2262451.1 glycosyltransferase [Halorubrum ezzemoulense]MDB2269232.1 glycosyltransferase [Halorubrum ezzemoulense]